MTMRNRYLHGWAAMLGAVACAAACVAAQGEPLQQVDRRMGEQVVFVPATIEGSAIKLQTTIFKPPGDGPFPVLFMNHGKAGGDAHLQERARYLVISSQFVQRGYAVVIPMRKGFAAFRQAIAQLRAEALALGVATQQGLGHYHQLRTTAQYLVLIRQDLRQGVGLATWQRTDLQSSHS